MRFNFLECRWANTKNDMRLLRKQDCTACTWTTIPLACVFQMVIFFFLRIPRQQGADIIVKIVNKFIKISDIKWPLVARGQKDENKWTQNYYNNSMQLISLYLLRKKQNSDLTARVGKTFGWITVFESVFWYLQFFFFSITFLLTIWGRPLSS